MSKWPVIENVAIFILIGFLCYLLESGWPILLILACNTKSGSKI